MAATLTRAIVALQVTHVYTISEAIMMLKPFVAASATALLLSGWAYNEPESRRQQSNPVMGAWRVIEVTRDSAGTRITRPAQPGLYLFTHRHYSVTRVDGTTPRRDFPPELRRTSDTYLEIWGPFAAHAGTFEVQTDLLVMRPTVAKNPSGMVPNLFMTNNWRIAGDTLWIQQIATSAGRITDGMQIKLVRAEKP
jgi:hypothetical protein